MGIFSSKEPCIECRTRTRNRNENGKPCCISCEEKLEREAAEKKIKEKIQQRTKHEKTHTCNNCNTTMQKVTYPDLETLVDVEIDEEEQAFVIIDRCPKCNAIFLDGDELEKIVEIAEEENYEDEDGNGFATGLILGMVINKWK